MVRRKVPQRLWDFALTLMGLRNPNRTSNTAQGLSGKCPLEKGTGKSVNKSEYLDFGFYGLGETKLGRWLGVSHCVGTLMSFWVLTMNGRVLSRTTVQHVTNLELQTAENKARTDKFDRVIRERLSAVDYFIQVDGEGNRQVLFDEIILYRTNGKETKQQDAYVVTLQRTNKRRRESTIGWELLVQ
jgi:hypothetical protein